MRTNFDIYVFFHSYDDFSTTDKIIGSYVNQALAEIT
jgi:hypothetical protein